MESNPFLAVSSLVFASWLRDADEPLETFRNLSTCLIYWGATRPKVLWLIAPQAAGCRPPRPSVGGGNNAGIDVWGLLDPVVPAVNPIMGWIPSASRVPPIL